MDRDPYEILGVAPDASQREIRRRFIALAERHRKEMLSDPRAYDAFEDTNAAYHLLSDSEDRRRYNAENGLPPPPAKGRTGGYGLLGTIDSMLPEEWYVVIPYFIMLAGFFFAHYLVTGLPIPGPFNFVANGPEDYVIYLVGLPVLVLLVRWMARWGE